MATATVIAFSYIIFVLTIFELMVTCTMGTDMIGVFAGVEGMVVLLTFWALGCIQNFGTGEKCWIDIFVFELNTFIH